MKFRSILAMVLIMGTLATPSYAFSVKTPFVKAGHALKVAGKKAGKVALYVAAGVAVIAFCSSGACSN